MRSSRHRSAKPGRNKLAMKTSNDPRRAVHFRDTNGVSRALSLPLLVCTGAVASMLTPVGALAISVGELRVQSALGQPLDASVPVELGAGEYLAASCLAVRPESAAELASVPDARLSLSDAATPGIHEVRITTARPLYEPMYSLSLEIKCPGTSIVVRQYVLMLDLPSVVQNAREALASPPGPDAPSAATAEAPAPASARAAPENVRPAAIAANGGPGSGQLARTRPRSPGSDAGIARGSAYRVQAGDTLSTIAARVSGRSTGGLWQMADEIFSANPRAFIGGNHDLIMLGSEIRIPDTPTGTPVATPSILTAQNPGSVPAVQMAPPAGAALHPGSKLVLGVPEAPAQSTAVAPPPPGSVFADEQPAVARQENAAPPAVMAPRVVSTVRSANDQRKSHPLLAAGLGVVLGAALSLLLLRQRLIEGLRGLGRRRHEKSATTEVPAPSVSPSPPAPAAPAPLRIGPSREASMVVEESQPETTEAAEGTTDNLPALAREPTDSRMPVPDGIDATQATRVGAGLAELYEEARLDEDLPETVQVAGAAVGPLDLDLTGVDQSTSATHVEDIGWLGDEAADLTRTQEAVAASASGETTAQMDLNTLANNDTNDEKLSQTLRDALALLEKDYEDEFSASQVLKMKSGSLAPASDDTDDTVARTGTGPNRRR